jgi:hypothetical protein
MSPHDDDTDGIIRQALEQEEAEAFLAQEDPTVATLLMATFKGRHRRLAIGGAILNLLLFVVAIVSVVRFFRADDALHVLRWGAAAFLCFGTIMAVKIWYWLEMVRLSLTRDLKRLELRVSRLDHGVRGKP